jgi:hypothetical protein
LAGVIGVMTVSFLAGCEGPRPQDRFRWHEIVGSVLHSKKTTGDPTYLDVRRVMPFDWDKFYVFPPYTPIDDIEKALGFGWGTAKKTKINERDDITLLVFVMGRTIQEYVEHPRSEGDFSKLKPGHPYDPAEAYFEVIEERQEGRSWFVFREAERSL